MTNNWRHTFALLACVGSLAASLGAQAADSDPPRDPSPAPLPTSVNSAPDGWLTPAGRYPEQAQPYRVDTEKTAGLHAEVLAGRLKIFCPWTASTNAPAPILWWSADTPGHWPARNWKRLAMVSRGTRIETTVPVEDLDTPILYFMAMEPTNPGAAQPAIVSPMRSVLPRGAGLEEPTEFFWKFLDGFEEGHESWRVLAPASDRPLITPDGEARTGHTALLAKVPVGKRSITLATTSLRGRQLVQHETKGVRVALRTRTGQGLARFTLHAYAHLPEQVAASWPNEIKVTAQWQVVELMWDHLPKMPWVAVDLLTIELVGQGPMEFLLDDVEYVTGSLSE